MATAPATPRGQWTIKSKRLDVELQNACRLAAERQGMSTGDWCAETLREGAREVLTGDARQATPPPLPARLEDVGEALMGEVERRMVELVERLSVRPVEAVPQAVPQAGEREARRLRTLLRRGRRLP